MAGKYATPIAMALTPEVDSYNPTTLKWGYAISSNGREGAYNPMDNNNIWVDNKFYVAVAFNSSHYQVVNNTWAESMDGWNRTKGINTNG